MRMCDVYSGAFLTIAAGSAGDGRGGLYLRDGPDVLSIKVQPPAAARDNSKDGGVVEFATVKSVPGHPRMETGDGEEDNSPWPLFERGWVLQERIMSPRVVYFLKDEVAWECASGGGAACECGMMGGEGNERGRKREYATALIEAEASGLGKQWRKLVQTYSCLKLSFGDDKLPALSGLAKQMMERKPAGVKYLAGLWSDELGSDLLWVRWALRSGYHLEEEVPEEGNGREQASEQRGPSWSWVKMNVRVVFPNGVQRKENVRKWEYYTVLDASTVLKTVDPTGKVSEGTLTIEGQLFDVQVAARTRSQALQGNRLSEPVEFGLIILESEREAWEAPHDYNVEGEVVFDNGRNPLGCGREPLKHPSTAIKALRLVRIRTWDGGYQIPRGFGNLVQVEETEHAIVLQRCASSTGATRYRRVGMIKQTRVVRIPETIFFRRLDDDDDIGMWRDNPGAFEVGGSAETVTIV